MEKVIFSIWKDHMKAIVAYTENQSKSIETCQLLRTQVKLTTWQIWIDQKALKIESFDPP